MPSTPEHPTSSAPAARVARAALRMALVLLWAASPAHAETQGYVIQWIHTATYPQKDNCPRGGNGERPDVQRKILLSRGYSPEQASQIIAYYGETVDGMNAPPDYHGPKFDFDKRGLLLGKAVDVGNFPTAEPDPDIETAQGRFMYGFDLTGKPTAYAFEDPETHQQVEDQMWRVLGCFASFRVPLSVIPYAESLTWETAEDAMPAWLLSISGADLSRDGEVSVTFDRALDLLVRNTYGGALRDASYRIDPDPRSHSVFKGHIKDGIVTIEPGDLYLQGELPFYQQLRFTQTHLRLKLHPDPKTLYYGGSGVVSGFLGGYQPWIDYFHFLATPGEEESHVEIAGVYDALKRLADGVPDPLTGQNSAISAVYYFEAAPVFLTAAAPQAPARSGSAPPTRRASSAPRRSGAALTVPFGITMVEVARALFLSQPQVLWLRPGDAHGHTLFTYELDRPGVSNCIGACAREFAPLLADAHASAGGEWTLLRRSDGTRQWAYQSHPLYRWSKERTAGEVATNVGLQESADLKLAEEATEAGSLLPPPHWQVARFAFGAGVQLPDGIAVNLIPSAQAVALTNAHGMTLYRFDGNVRRDRQRCASSGCDPEWRPLLASELALGLGDFSVVTRADGSKQWAYRRQPLYQYRGDVLPGDAHGVGVDAHWQLALLTQNFQPAGVTVSSLEGYGDVLTFNGMTLYGSHFTDGRNGGYSLRGNFTFLYAQDKQLGTAACLDASCLRRWRPLPAPPDAQPDGFWEVLTRPDGSKQWAYKGSALYLYAADRAPGDHNGQGLIDYAPIEGSAEQLQRALFFADAKAGRGSLGVYWSLAKP